MKRTFRKVPVLAAQKRSRKAYIRSAEDVPKVLTREDRIRLFGEKPQGEIEIPYGVTAIGADAFYNCYWLTGVTIPDSVTEIGRNAFADCTVLKSVTLPTG